MSALEEVAKTKRGYSIFREPNEAGGYRYWSDAIGGGAVVYDSCITGLDELVEVLRIEYGMGIHTLAAPPEPPLPWLAFDLERGSKYAIGYAELRRCDGIFKKALAAQTESQDDQIATLTTQLAEARGLLERASDALECVLNNEDWDADAVETVANALTRYNDQPTSPQAALTALTGGE